MSENKEETKAMFSKPARNADELLEKLKSRGLDFDESEEIFIKLKIRSIGYYRLSGYFGPLQNPKDTFKPNTKFGDILRLYEFDRKLKLLVFGLLENVEVELRTRLTDVYSLGNDSFWYANGDLFNHEIEQFEVLECTLNEDKELVQQYKTISRRRYDSLLSETLKSVERFRDTEYMNAFYNKYSVDSPIPSWMVMEGVSFGKLSRFYALLNASPEKTNIANHFGAINKDYFISWLHGLVVLRNACAHHGRLWNRYLGKDVKMPTLSRKRFITEREDADIRKFYGISSILLKIFTKINPDEGELFKKTFFNLVEEHDIDYKAMGFPEKWQEDEIWKG